MKMKNIEKIQAAIYLKFSQNDKYSILLITRYLLTFIREQSNYYLNILILLYYLNVY